MKISMKKVKEQCKSYIYKVKRL